MNRRCTEGGVQGEIFGTVGGAGGNVAAAPIAATGAQSSPGSTSGVAILAGLQRANSERVTDGSYLFADA